jgi:hypothetical protein
VPISLSYTNPPLAAAGLAACGAQRSAGGAINARALATEVCALYKSRTHVPWKPMLDFFMYPPGIDFKCPCSNRP